MDKNEKLKLQLAIDQADTWAKQYAKIDTARSSIRTEAARALKTLRGSIVPVEVKGQTFNVLPLGAAQLAALSKFSQFIQLAPISADDQELVHQLETEIPQSLAEAQRGLASRHPSADDLEAAQYVMEYARWGLGSGLPAALDRITPPDAGTPVEASHALQPQTGLAQALKNYGAPQLVSADEFRSRLTGFGTAQHFTELARALNPAHGYVVVCSPADRTARDLLTAIELADN